MGMLTRWAWAQEPDGVLSKLLLSFLCCCLEERKSPSIEDLCDVAEASAKQVFSVLEDLRRDGLITFNDPLGVKSTITVNVRMNLDIVPAAMGQGIGEQ